MRLLGLLIALLLMGCPPALNNPSSGAMDDDDTTSGDDDDVVGDDDDTVDPPFLQTGMTCTDNAECLSGICWDWADYDPWCGGAVCSDRCEGDEECWDWADAAGANSPESAVCGDDSLCVFISTGLGDFWCADGVQ